MRFNLKSPQVRWGIVLAAFSAYVLLFFLLYPRFSEGSAALAILPVAVIAWLGGIRFGLLAGVLSFPLNTLLLDMVQTRANPWAVVIQSGGGPGSVAIVLIGLIVGLLHDQREQIARELAQRQQVESTLRESEQRYRMLFESTQRQAQKLELLDQVGLALARELELPLVFRTVVEGIAQTFGYTQVSLYLVDDNALVLQHQVGYEHVFERIPLTEGVSGRVVRSKQPVFLEDVHNDPAFLGAIEGITSEVCVPLFDQGQVVGILNVESTHGVRLSEADLRLITALGNQIGIALARARLYSDVRESEQRFRQLAEHIEQVFWLEDPERPHTFYVSPAYEAVWGRPRQSLYEQPRSWSEAIHPDDRERVLAEQARKVSGEYNIEYRVIRPDGSLRWVWSRAFPVRDQHGQVYRIAGIAEDITERKVAEEALRASQTMFQGLFDSSPDALIVVNGEGQIVQVNAQVEALFGYAADELLGQPVEILLPRHFQESHTRHRAHYMTNPRQRPMGMGLQLYGRRKDGSEFPVDISLGTLATDAGSIVLGTVRDITKRKQMANALRESEEKLQNILRHSSSMFYTHTPDHVLTYVSPQSRHILDCEPEEAMVRWQEFLSDNPSNRQGIEATKHAIVTGLRQPPYELELITRKGRKIWVQVDESPVVQDGKTIAIVGSITDVTKRKQAEEALAASESRYRLATQATNDVIWEWSSKTHKLMWTENAQHVFGYAPEEIGPDETWWDNHIHPEDRQRVVSRLNALIEGRETIWSEEYRFLLKDGSYACISDHGYIERDGSGEAIRMIGAMSNITERVRAEEALRQSEDRFKLMAWATKDAVWDWDMQKNQVWWGEGLQKIFHYSSETIQTNAEWWFDHIHPEDRAKVHRTIDQALEGGMEFWSKEYRFQRKDGSYADMIDRGYILRDDLGKPYRMIGAMMDITERKYMESTLLEANEQMRQFLNELQDRNREVALLNEMSHLLQACQSEEEAYQIIADLSNQLFPCTAGALYLLNTSSTLANAVTSWGELPIAERLFPPDDCLALRPGQSHSLSEDHTGQRCLHLTEPLPALSYCLPMQVQGEILGILNIQAQQEANLDESKRQLAHTVVEQSTMALSNLKLREVLREQSVRDPITGLYNRRYMEEALKQQLSRVTRLMHLLGIIMIDIDHFKRFNDTHGHAAGDALLRELGQFLQMNIRGEDIACRYGGEEFMLIMPDVSLEVAQKRAEHLRQQARQLRVQDADQSYEAITLSLGIAIYPQHGRSIETVLRAADQALYRAKHEGRDRVVIAE